MSTGPRITLIAAMSRNRVIGRGGALPWRMPADLKRFKQRTMGYSVIMGRKTWATMKGPLPGRTNIVITRDAGFKAEGFVFVHALDEAINAAKTVHPAAEETFVVGGAEIYRMAMPIADRIDLTQIDVAIDDGDAFFPEFESDSSWRMVCEEKHAADEKHAHAFAFREYERDRRS